ncbi:MAG TPA: tripartite tricarboxylate transporter substrate binding protein [Burkholderiales bacterium]|jgi:tripartite-type tricarboxylate transporter receptor subunit TctC
MKRWLLPLAAPLFALSATLACTQASAQTPKPPMRIIVPFAAGGASDFYSRIVAQKITEQTGKTIVVENRTGAGGRIAFEYAAHAPNDGSVVALIDATYAMLPGLFDKRLPWDINSDLVPAAMITQTPFVIIVPTKSKYQTLMDLINDAKARPGKLNFGSAGVGSVNHIVTERFRSDAKITITHIPYRGMSEASVALQAGELDLIIAASPTALGPIQGGKVRALAVTTAKRSAALPNVPTASEAGVPPYITTNWFGWAVPKGTSKEFIQTLHEDVVKAVNSPDVRDRLAAQGAEPSNFTTEDFARFLREDTKRWTDVIKANNIKIE